MEPGQSSLPKPQARALGTEWGCHPLRQLPAPAVTALHVFCWFYRPSGLMHTSPSKSMHLMLSRCFRMASHLSPACHSASTVVSRAIPGDRWQSPNCPRSLAALPTAQVQAGTLLGIPSASLSGCGWSPLLSPPSASTLQSSVPPPWWPESHLSGSTTLCKNPGHT